MTYGFVKGTLPDGVDDDSSPKEEADGVTADVKDETEGAALGKNGSLGLSGEMIRKYLKFTHTSLLALEETGSVDDDTASPVVEA